MPVEESARLRLPEGFLFGAATAAHQVEGNNVASDWWAFEHRPGSPVRELSGDAADSYHRWRQDMDLLAELGFTAYRFSVEWARVEPAPGHFSRAALAHYRRMVEGAVARGLEPVVTLHHFTSPAWFAARGGWTAPGSDGLFSRYASAVATAVLGDEVRYAATVNEPNMLAVMQTLLRAGLDAAPSLGHIEPEPAIVEALTRAHRAARAALKDVRPGLLTGWTVANQVYQPEPGAEQPAQALRPLARRPGQVRRDTRRIPRRVPRPGPRPEPGRVTRSSRVAGMPRRGPYEKGEAKRAEILRAALRIFAEDGYRGTSLRKVAAACDLSLPGLMHYFESKEDLLTQVLRARDESARLRHGDLAHLDDYLRIVREGAATPGLVELFVSLAASAGDPEHPAHELFGTRYDTLREALTAHLERSAAAGDLPETVPPDRLAVLLIALVDGIQLQWLADRTISMEQPVLDLFAALGRSRPADNGGPRGG